jgi:hypothetical protein
MHVFVLVGARVDGRGRRVTLSGSRGKSSSGTSPAGAYRATEGRTGDLGGSGLDALDANARRGRPPPPTRRNRQHDCAQRHRRSSSEVAVDERERCRQRGANADYLVGMRDLALADLTARLSPACSARTTRCSWNTKAGLNGGGQGAVLVGEHAWRVGSHRRHGTAPRTRASRRLASGSCGGDDRSCARVPEGSRRPGFPVGPGTQLGVPTDAPAVLLGDLRHLQ